MRLREVAKVPISADAYSIYIRQSGQGNAQVFALDYGDKMRVYDVSGSLKSARNWSSKVRCIAVGDIDGEGKDALVGGVGKRVLVVDHQGKPMWKIELESTVIACDARDVDGDDSAEVVVALQNNRVILWNDDKEALFSRRMEGNIADVWLEDITEDKELEVVVADRHGNLTILTSAGYILRRLKLGNALTVFGVLTFGKRKLFVTGEREKELIIWDIDGNQIEKIELTGRPKALATGVADDESDTTYLVVSTDDRRLSFWEIIASTKETREEKTILQEIESTKMTLYRRAIKCGNCGAPSLPEAKRCNSCGAVLERLAEYKVKEFIKESIDSITTKHSKIKLKELDRILRRTLPGPASYNLRRSLQSMIECKEIEGHLDRNTFVRTVKQKKETADMPSKEKLGNIPAMRLSRRQMMQ
ncbi:MAG: zinc ribbon domain-containing protein [Candidatus Thorarchaeota archaeon]